MINYPEKEEKNKVKQRGILKRTDHKQSVSPLHRRAFILIKWRIKNLMRNLR